MEKFELVKETLDNMSESDLFWLYKEYVCQAQLYDDEIFDMNEFDEIMCASTPTDIAQKIFYGNFVQMIVISNLMVVQILNLLIG